MWRSTPNDPWDRDIMIAMDPSAAVAMEAKGHRAKPVPLLIGTLNKLEEYSLSQIQNDLQHGFLHLLSCADLLVIAGYGFGDIGVNARIINWMYGRRGRRLVVIDPQVERAKDSPGVWAHWDRWLEFGVLFPLRQLIECTAWTDVLAAMSA
jgi:hypothetical protein